MPTRVEGLSAEGTPQYFILINPSQNEMKTIWATTVHDADCGDRPQLFTWSRVISMLLVVSHEAKRAALYDLAKH